MPSGRRRLDDDATRARPRAIDVPIEELTPVDEHAVELDVSQREAWEALIPALREALGGPLTERLAGALGCAETAPSGDLTHPGATLAGFVVARVVPPTLYGLLGAHRYSRYALIFSIDRLPGERSRVRAESRAEFPGRSGSAYRAAVVGSRIHGLAVRRLLAAVERRACRPVSS